MDQTLAPPSTRSTTASRRRNHVLAGLTWLIAIVAVVYIGAGLYRLVIVGTADLGLHFMEQQDVVHRINPNLLMSPDDPGVPGFDIKQFFEQLSRRTVFLWGMPSAYPPWSFFTHFMFIIPASFTATSWLNAA